jgi:hypothetical protein
VPSHASARRWRKFGTKFEIMTLDGAFLRQAQARGSFEYSGVVFEEYRGRVGTVGFTDASKAYFFPVGVPGLAPGSTMRPDFVETANTIGLRRYAKQAVDSSSPAGSCCTCSPTRCQSAPGRAC